MAREQYYVVLHGRAWKIKYNGRHYGPYATQLEAINRAVEAAHKVGLEGAEAVVLVQGLDSEYRVEWTYGLDPYPPLE